MLCLSHNMDPTMLCLSHNTRPVAPESGPRPPVSHARLAPLPPNLNHAMVGSRRTWYTDPVHIRPRTQTPYTSDPVHRPRAQTPYTDHNLNHAMVGSRRTWYRPVASSRPAHVPVCPCSHRSRCCRDEQEEGKISGVERARSRRIAAQRRRAGADCSREASGRR
jgi:hypothetical protein